jgi:hypothetical protein
MEVNVDQNYAILHNQEGAKTAPRLVAQRQK